MLDVVAMNAACIENSDEFEHQAMHTGLEREAFGAVDRYSNMQPTSSPTIEKYLIDKWIDVLLQYFIDNGRTEILWIKGEVILLSDETNIPNNQGVKACYKYSEAVMTHLKKKERNEVVSELPQHLLR